MNRIMKLLFGEREPCRICQFVLAPSVKAWIFWSFFSAIWYQNYSVFLIHSPLSLISETHSKMNAKTVSVCFWTGINATKTAFLEQLEQWCAYRLFLFFPLLPSYVLHFALSSRRPLLDWIKWGLFCRAPHNHLGLSLVICTSITFTCNTWRPRAVQ